MVVQRIIIGIWIAAPVVFLLFALWATLERSAKNKATHPGEYLKSAAFLAVSGLLAFAIHIYALDWIISLMPVDLPRNLYLLILWPMLLFFGAKILEPSRDIMISKPPDLTRKKH